MDEQQSTGETKEVRPQAVREFVMGFQVPGVERGLRDLDPEDRATREDLIKRAKEEVVALCKNQEQQLTPVQQRVMSRFLEETMHGNFKFGQETEPGEPWFSADTEKMLIAATYINSLG